MKENRLEKQYSRNKRFSFETWKKHEKKVATNAIGIL